jgi:hypothetical protein
VKKKVLESAKKEKDSKEVEEEETYEVLTERFPQIFRKFQVKF